MHGFAGRSDDVRPAHRARRLRSEYRLRVEESEQESRGRPKRGGRPRFGSICGEVSTVAILRFWVGWAQWLSRGWVRAQPRPKRSQCKEGSQWRTESNVCEVLLAPVLLGDRPRRIPRISR